MWCGFVYAVFITVCDLILGKTLSETFHFEKLSFIMGCDAVKAQARSKTLGLVRFLVF